MNLHARSVARRLWQRAHGEGNAGERFGLLCAGGAQAGVYGAGVMRALTDLGLEYVFDVVVGVSAGAANAAYLLAHQAAYGSTIYFEDNCRGFINPWRPWNIASLQHVEETMRKRKMLDTKSILGHPSAFHVTVTNLEGQGEFINAKDPSCGDVVHAVMASCCLPPPYQYRLRKLNGRRYLDGGIALPLPVREVSERYNLTHLLAVINYPIREKPEEIPWFEQIAAGLTLRRHSRSLEEAFLTREVRYHESVRLAHGGIVPNGCQVALIAPQTTIVRHCTKPDQLIQRMEEGRTSVQQFFLSESVSL